MKDSMSSLESSLDLRKRSSMKLHIKVTAAEQNHPVKGLIYKTLQTLCHKSGNGVKN